jgi:hypothetical protein
MKLLMICHMYVPHHNAGGETTIHAVFREMVNRGHSVDVICRPGAGEIKFDPYVYEGVKVVRPPERNEQEWFRGYAKKLNPDLLLTHLDLTFEAMQLAIDIRKPIAHFVHNSMQFAHHRVSVNKCQLAIFNSEWVARREEWRGPQVVIHPIIEPERYKCEKGTKITLVNPTPGKGEGTFYGLSRLMPDYEFLVVKSVYGEQVFPPAIKAENFPNVEFMQHTPDIREVFRKTKVLLMPSDYESYGRVGVEAACAGIPTIAHPTEGLLEALANESPTDLVGFTRAVLRRERVQTPERLKGGWVSGAGIFCDREDLESWKGQLERLYSDDIYYRSRSDAALKLAASLDPKGEFDRLEEALLVTTQRWEAAEGAMEKVVYSNRRFGKKADGRLTDQMNEAQSLVCGGPGTAIPFEYVREAQELGYTDTPAVQLTEKREVLLDTSTLDPGHGTKAIDEPEENKAIAAPEDNKARRRKKTA